MNLYLVKRNSNTSWGDNVAAIVAAERVENIPEILKNTYKNTDLEWEDSEITDSTISYIGVYAGVKTEETILVNQNVGS